MHDSNAMRIAVQTMSEAASLDMRGMKQAVSLGCTGVRVEHCRTAGTPDMAVGTVLAPQQPSMPEPSSRKQQQQHRGTVVLRVDEEHPVEAACGVRVMWVSKEARRKGIATKLLDVARWDDYVCNCAATSKEYVSL
jgi:hypothetical protein